VTWFACDEILQYFWYTYNDHDEEKKLLKPINIFLKNSWFDSDWLIGNGEMVILTQLLPNMVVWHQQCNDRRLLHDWRHLVQYEKMILHDWRNALDATWKQEQKQANKNGVEWSRLPKQRPKSLKYHFVGLSKKRAHIFSPHIAELLIILKVVAWYELWRIICVS
jgi:hypothetical protein